LPVLGHSIDLPQAGAGLGSGDLRRGLNAGAAVRPGLSGSMAERGILAGSGVDVEVFEAPEAAAAGDVGGPGRRER
jgi:hypothetical protein